MKGVQAAAVAAAALAVAASAAASAGTPAGMREQPRLEPAAVSVAGKPVTVDCALTRQAMQDATGVSDALGYSPVIGGDTSWLAPNVCGYLLAWQNGKRVTNLYGVAGALLTLAHEMQHLTGVRDETDAECGGLHAMPRMVTGFFPLRKRTTMHTLMGLAWQFRANAPPSYHAHAC